MVSIGRTKPKESAEGTTVVTRVRTLTAKAKAASEEAKKSTKKANITIVKNKKKAAPDSGPIVIDGEEQAIVVDEDTAEKQREEKEDPEDDGHIVVSSSPFFFVSAFIGIKAEMDALDALPPMLLSKKESVRDLETIFSGLVKVKFTTRDEEGNVVAVQTLKGRWCLICRSVDLHCLFYSELTRSCQG